MELKPWRQAIPKGLILLVVTLGLIVPGSIAKQDQKSPEGAKALGKVCGLSEREKHCASKDAEKKAAQAREKAAKDREVTLSKLDPCDRFFARLGAKEIDKINPDDAMACRREMKTCPPSCLRKQ